MDAISSALSGLQAASARRQAGGNNVANLLTDGYQATRVDLADQPSGGVRVAKVSKDETPGNPAGGSNVDLAREFTNAFVDGLLYNANLKVVQTEDERLKSTLDLKA
ncbi:MAG TPA: flagellar basal body rod C-terminal domain-containing protein [Holophagaceae bacterium]|nr:flagellar basal body rod C-terminal domain-containing protein [Holophagaceae bacterium]